MEALQLQKEKVIVIIAGGRDFIPNRNHLNWTVNLLKEIKAEEVVSGCAKGADRFGEDIAKLLSLPIAKFPADWDSYGKKAGHLRNEQMARYANNVILFPGGRGTENMKTNAQRYKLNIFEYKE